MNQALPGDTLRIKADEWNAVRRLANPKFGISNNPKVFPTEILYAKAPSSGIDGRVAENLGKATVEIYYRDESDNLVSFGESVTAYNISATAVAANSWLILGREFITKDFVVLVESCEPAS